LTGQWYQVQPTSPTSIDDYFGFESSNQLISSKEEGTNNDSDDGDGGSLDYNQLLGSAMGAKRGKEIVDGQSKGSNGQE
jgi:hypothetical protein